MNNNIVFRLYNPFSQYDEVKKIWQSMLERCPHPYYLSWAWTEIWLKSLPTDIELYLISGHKEDLPVIAFFLGSKTIKRLIFFKFRQIALNQTLIHRIDSATYIEYNSILIDPDLKITLELLLELMPIRSWDEFKIIRSSSKYQPNLILNSRDSRKYHYITAKRESYFVNLEKVRDNKNNYLSLISKNKREQIRRSIKEYEKMGEIQVHIADNIEMAMNYFNEFVVLHQQRWTALGCEGAFANQYTIDYHKNLISERFNSGEIQLIKISAGKYIVGYLYHFIYQKVVYFNLSGFNYLPGNIYRPGLVCHYLAIKYNALKGLTYYDFMDGEHEYKKSLATDYNAIYDSFIQRKSIKEFIVGTTTKFMHSIIILRKRIGFT